MSYGVPVGRRLRHVAVAYSAILDIGMPIEWRWSPREVINTLLLTVIAPARLSQLLIVTRRVLLILHRKLDVFGLDLKNGLILLI